MNEGKNALLVEDNDELQGTLREVLEDLGYAVTTAGDAGEALAAAPEGGFDLLVSDICMPGMTGIDLADRLLARAPELAVLLISSRGGEPQVRRRLAAGDVAFLAKPFSPDELAEKVAAAFEVASSRHDAAPVVGSDRDDFESASRQPEMPGRALSLIGALGFVLAITALWRGFEPGPPPLPPAPAPGAVTRGAIIDVDHPLGRLEVAPDELVWRPIENASSYAVSINAIDGTALWRAEAATPPVVMPAGVQGTLLRTVTYYWSVEARDDDGNVLARSELAPFVITERPE